MGKYNTNIMANTDSHKNEVQEGERFEFGKNWAKFLSVLNDERIEEAKKSLRQMLGYESLSGKTFMDIGSGSGLFSLAARSLGAQVISFDYDPFSVACTKELKNRYFKDDALWVVQEGSVLNKDFIQSLPKVDIVYSWGRYFIILAKCGKLLTMPFCSLKRGGLFS
jgi:2-polyprenyl-6-hydroxyphenyl methylase/3-demethylubiquinone-9 3-methyltransferase